MAIRINMNEMVRLPLLEWALMYCLLLLAYAGLLQRRKQKVYQAHGEMLSGQETMKFHPALAAHLKDVDMAIILFKIYEWMEVNRSKNSRMHFINGRWWTAYSYKKWQEKHFPWLSWQTVRTKFQKLEAMGLLIGEAQRPGDATKWYTLDDRVFNLIRGDSDLVEGGLNVSRPPLKLSPGGTQNESTSIYKTKKKSNKRIKRPAWGGATETPSAISDGLDGADYQADREPVDEAPPVAAPAPVDGYEAKWQVAHEQLALLIDRSSFDAWMKEAAFESYADGRMTIAVPNEYALNACQHRLYRNIRRVVGDVLDVKQDEIELRFVVREVAQT